MTKRLTMAQKIEGAASKFIKIAKENKITFVFGYSINDKANHGIRGNPSTVAYLIAQLERQLHDQLREMVKINHD